MAAVLTDFTRRLSSSEALLRAGSQVRVCDALIQSVDAASLPHNTLQHTSEAKKQTQHLKPMRNGTWLHPSFTQSPCATLVSRLKLDSGLGWRRINAQIAKQAWLHVDICCSCCTQSGAGSSRSVGNTDKQHT